MANLATFVPNTLFSHNELIIFITWAGARGVEVFMGNGDGDLSSLTEYKGEGKGEHGKLTSREGRGGEIVRMLYAGKFSRDTAKDSGRPLKLRILTYRV